MFSIVEGYDINYQIVMSITILGIIHDFIHSYSVKIDGVNKA
jgi:hypothetical protein